MLKKYVDQYGKKPKYLFASSTGNPLTTIVNEMNEVFSDHFGQKLMSQFKYNPTSIRKCWDTHFETNEEFKAKHSKAHEIQSGHSEATRKKYYTKLPEKSAMSGVLDYYETSLTGSVKATESTVRERENEFHIIKAAWTDIPKESEVRPPVAGPSHEVLSPASGPSNDTRSPIGKISSNHRRLRNRSNINYANMEQSDIDSSEDDEKMVEIQKKVETKKVW